MWPRTRPLPATLALLRRVVVRRRPVPGPGSVALGRRGLATGLAIVVVLNGILSAVG